MRRALVLVVLFGCGPRSRTIAMHAQNNSAQDGQATFVDNGDGTIGVTEVLHPSSFPGPQSSHIHHGRCDDLRDIEFFVFQVDGGPSYTSDGGLQPPNKPFAGDGGTITFQNTLTTTWEHIFDGDHALNAHDPRDFMLYASCGDLTRE